MNFLEALWRLLLGLFGINSGIGGPVNDPEAPFTIIFMSDLETMYRGHSIARSQTIVDYIVNLGNTNNGVYFDGAFSDIPIDPQLILHGGDISHFWSCPDAGFGFEVSILGGCRDAGDEFKDVWKKAYNRNIPMISAFGNHDWAPRSGTGNYWEGPNLSPRDAEVDYINTESQDFVRRSYEQSKSFGLEYEEFPPTGSIGQSMYRATFRGIQIASFNAAANWQSYDDNGIYMADAQFHALSDSLDRNLTTLFFSHFPLSSLSSGFSAGNTPTISEVTSLISEFDGAPHFAGHVHRQRINEYDAVHSSAGQSTINEYVAAYPHHWQTYTPDEFGRPGGLYPPSEYQPNVQREPGFYAILVSPSSGILQVKAMNMPGLESGALCIPWTYLNYRNWFFGLDNRSAGSSLSSTRAVGKDQQHTEEPRMEDLIALEVMSNHTLAELNLRYEKLWVARSSLDGNACSRCKAGSHRWPDGVGDWFACR